MKCCADRHKLQMDVRVQIFQTQKVNQDENSPTASENLRLMKTRKSQAETFLAQSPANHETCFILQAASGSPAPSARAQNQTQGQKWGTESSSGHRVRECPASTPRPAGEPGNPCQKLDSFRSQRWRDKEWSGQCGIPRITAEPPFFPQLTNACSTCTASPGRAALTVLCQPRGRAALGNPICGRGQPCTASSRDAARPCCGSAQPGQSWDRCRAVESCARV